MTFKEKIVKLRKMKGLTQDEFASAVGVSRQAVYKWECGQSYPEVAKLIEIKMLLGISIDDLLDESYEVIVPEKKRKKRISKAEKAAIEASVAGETEQTVVAATVLETAAEPVVEVAAEPVAEPVVEAVAEPVAEPVVEAVAEPVAEPVVDAVAEPVAEPVVEAVAEPVAEEPAVEAAEPAVEETVVEESAEETTAEAPAADEPKAKKKSLEDSFLDRLPPEKRGLWSRLFKK